ncbi:MAG: PDZ domain-containing protein [Oscillospiraceae bacterium]|nr:PDZ domain-containing protein [Oscillospiraceae bacterium]
MNRKVPLGGAVTFTLLLMIATFCLTMIYSNQMFNKRLGNVNEREQMYAKLAELDTTVRNKYDGTIDAKQLEDGLAEGYVSGLGDEYAQYLTAEEYTAYRQAQNGETAGIGATVYAEASGYLQVGEVQEGSPAVEAGILPGDLIVQVNGIACTTENAEELLASLTDKAGTTVSLVYRREAEDKSVELVRRQSETVRISYKQLTNTVGVIRVLSFDPKTSDEFELALEDLKSKGISNLIFDLRNLRSADLESVCSCLELLVAEGPLAVAQYQTTSEILYKSTSSGITGMNMVVLINENTAQGAELFAAVLKDYNLAVLVGTQTSGLGIVQELLPLSDGSAVWLTVAKLAPPKSESFDKTGLSPDYLQTMPSDNPNAIISMDINQDSQLKKATEVLLGIGSANQETSSSPEEESNLSEIPSETSSGAEESTSEAA